VFKSTRLPRRILFSRVCSSSFLEALQNEPYNAPPFPAGQNFGLDFARFFNATRRRFLGPRSGIFVAHPPVSRNVLADTAREALRILVWQMGWIVAIAFVGALAWSWQVALAILVGGGIGSIWTIYMALTLFKHSVFHGARMSSASFLVAWLVKLGLTIGLLVIAFRSKLFAPLGILGGLGVALVSYWVWLTFRVNHADRADGK
jgi:F0F1-type ATP synthase assembly protein I